MDNEPMRESAGMVKVFFTRKEEAEDLVKEFWTAMPHGADIMRIGEASGWSQELTMGDRTMVGRTMEFDKRMVTPFTVIFKGNHQSLSQEAESFLRGKGYLVS